jgi:hypothetical protein
LKYRISSDSDFANGQRDAEPKKDQQGLGHPLQEAVAVASQQQRPQGRGYPDRADKAHHARGVGCHTFVYRTKRIEGGDQRNRQM